MQVTVVAVVLPVGVTVVWLFGIKTADFEYLISQQGYCSGSIVIFADYPPYYGLTIVFGGRVFDFGSDRQCA